MSDEEKNERKTTITLPSNPAAMVALVIALLFGGASGSALTGRGGDRGARVSTEIRALRAQMDLRFDGLERRTGAIEDKLKSPNPVVLTELAGIKRRQAPLERKEQRK